MSATSLKQLCLPLALAAIAASVFPVRGDLMLIPPLAGDTVNEARAITPDGKYVAGNSGSRGFLYTVGAADAINVISSDNAQSTVATGIGMRTYQGEAQIIVSGLTSSGMADWMTANGGVTWAAKRRLANLGASPWSVPAANGLGASTTSDVFYDAFRDNNNYLRVEKMWGVWAPSSNSATLMIDAKSVPTGETATLNGVSASGRAVGKRGPRNYAMDWTGGGSGAVWFPTGLQGNQTGQVFSVSADGSTLFGQSPVGDGRTGSWGYKSVYAGTTLASIYELPTFPNTAGSTSLAVPYGCTVDGGFASGMCYRGTERAVLWDTRDSDPAKWTVIDLTDLAAFEGTLGNFTRLTRGYTVGLDGAGSPVVAGVGAWFDGAAYITRAFVMTLSPPRVKLTGSPTDGLVFSFQTLAGKTYSLWYKTDLLAPGPWTPLGSVTGNGSILTLTDSPGLADGQRFYRLQVQ